MKPAPLCQSLALALLLSACSPVRPQPSATPPPTLSEPPAPIPAATRTPIASVTPPPPTPTTAPQPILLRRRCGKDYLVRANEPLQIVYGGWGVKGKDLADQWSTSLVVELIIDGQPVSGVLQLPTHELPYNCTTSSEDTYWLYFMVLIPGLSAGDHDVTATISALRPLPDGTGPIFGPGEILEQTFTISTR